MPMRAGRASPCTTAAPPLRASGSRQKFGDRLKLERLVRFECGLLGGMHRWYVHAAVKTAVEKEQRRGREACIEVSRGVARKNGHFLFLSHPLVLGVSCKHPGGLLLLAAPNVKLLLLVTALVLVTA